MSVSVLFNEPKLLKSLRVRGGGRSVDCFSALQRAEIAEIGSLRCSTNRARSVSVLFNEPKLLKYDNEPASARVAAAVSVLFNEPKLLKFYRTEGGEIIIHVGFSALQRAEIAEIRYCD